MSTQIGVNLGQIFTCAWENIQRTMADLYPEASAATFPSTTFALATHRVKQIFTEKAGETLLRVQAPFQPSRGYANVKGS